MYIVMLMFSVSAWVFPGVSVLYVKNMKEVGVCGDSISSCEPCWCGAKSKRGLNLCFIVVVVVVVIVWGIILGPMCEMGYLLIVSVL